MDELLKLVGVGALSYLSGARALISIIIRLSVFIRRVFVLLFLRTIAEHVCVILTMSDGAEQPLLSSLTQEKLFNTSTKEHSINTCTAKHLEENTWDDVFMRW